MQTHELEQVEKELEGLKIKNNPKPYNGNDLKSACDFYGLYADTWVSIIRYEDGYDAGIDAAITLIKSKMKPKTYEEDYSHTHCFEDYQRPEIEHRLHLRCCLCPRKSKDI